MTAGEVTADAKLPGLEWARSFGRVRTYRPGKRAVVESTCGAYIKVVHPDAFERLVSAHRRLAHLPLVPQIELADAELGVVVLQPMPGVPCRQAVLVGAPAPSAEHLDAALAPVWQLGLVHGDFNDANVLVDGDGAVSGLVDLDRSRPGEPDDDRATLLAHLTALSVYRPHAAASVDRYRRSLEATWGTPRRVDRVIDALAGRAEQIGRSDVAARLRTRVGAALVGPPRNRTSGVSARVSSRA